MSEFKKMTVQRLRDLARKSLGPGHSKLKTKDELVAALEKAEAGRAPKRPAVPPPPARGTARSVAVKAVAAVRKAGETAREKLAQVTSTRAAKPSRAVKAVKAAAGAVAGAVVGAAAGAAVSGRARRGPPEDGGPDPDGFFVARVRGEEAVREAPHPMMEGEPRGRAAFRAIAEDRPRVGPYDEGLGDLPWSYGDDAFVALPRDPRTLFLYWDLSRGTLAAGFSGLDHPRAQLWVFGRAGDGWDRLRTVEFAVESRSYYVHELEPGRTYRAEIHAIDRAGRDRLVGRPSNEVALPPVGPSPVVDDRFIRIPWDLVLGRLLGPGHPGAPFSDDARALLARLSDWSRFGKTWGGSAGGVGGRPSSPIGSPGRED
jgi:hypothetical protein